MADQVTGLLSGQLRTARLKAARPYLKGRVLDVGCGVGELADACDPEGYVGIDIDTESIATASNNHPQHSFVTVLPEGREFDAIVMLALIEHIPNPVSFLARHAPLLAPGGRMVLTTPHKNAEWLHVLGASVGLFSKSAKDEHETLFNLQLMERAAEEAGLNVELYRKFLFGVNQLFILNKPTQP